MASTTGPDYPWTAASVAPGLTRVQWAVERFNEGWSGGRIAKELALLHPEPTPTRNAVSGKLHRAGAMKRPSNAGRMRASPEERAAMVGKKPERDYPPQMRSKKPKAANAIYGGNPHTSPRQKKLDAIRANAASRPVLATSDGQAVAQLGPDLCKWPIGDPLVAGFHFCGGQAARGRPYCPEHCAVAWPPSEKAEKDKRRAARDLMRLARA